MRKLRLAVIGAGQFGKNHCRAVHESERAELAAVVDANQARAEEMAAAYGTRAFTDFRQVEGIDAAIVAGESPVNRPGTSAATWKPSSTISFHVSPCSGSRCIAVARMSSASSCDACMASKTRRAGP